MKQFIARIFKHVTLFQLLLIGLLIYIVFIDENSYMQRIKYNHELKDLKEQITDLTDEIEQCKYKLNELQSNENNLEQFAREQYLMKRPNEDIFIIEE